MRQTTCLNCYQPFLHPRKSARFCTAACRSAYRHGRRALLGAAVLGAAVLKAKELPLQFEYARMKDRAIRMPVTAHRWHPQNVLKIDDRTNYYRGNGIFGYDDPKPGAETRP